MIGGEILKQMENGGVRINKQKTQYLVRGRRQSRGNRGLLGKTEENEEFMYLRYVIRYGNRRTRKGSAPQNSSRLGVFENSVSGVVWQKG